MPITLLFVINPISGGKLKNDYEESIKKYFEPLSHKIEFFLLKGKNDAEELEKCIQLVKPEKIVAVGGDGTVSMVAKKILGTDMQLAILPAGSANGMARELNISLNIEEALHTVEAGVVRKADAININDEICLHLSDIGLNARLIKYFEEGNSRGIFGYAKVALKALLNNQAIRVIVQTGEKKIIRNALMVVLANASKYGTGAVINPQGDLYDGLFEVVIIRQLGLITFLKVWLRPRHYDPKKIEIIQAKSVRIETRRKVHFQIDGEYKGKVNLVMAKILQGKLNIILPE